MLGVGVMHVNKASGPLTGPSLQAEHQARSHKAGGRGRKARERSEGTLVQLVGGSFPEGGLIWNMKRIWAGSEGQVDTWQCVFQRLKMGLLGR